MNLPAGRAGELACTALGQPFPKQQKWVSVQIHLRGGIMLLVPKKKKEKLHHNPSVAMPINCSVIQKSAESTSLSGFAQSP